MSGCCPFSDPKIYESTNQNAITTTTERGVVVQSDEHQQLGPRATTSCAKKPLSEWSKLKTKIDQCDNTKWVPLKQKGKVAACNPAQLSNLQTMRDNIETNARKHNAVAISWNDFNGGALGSYTEAEQLTNQTANDSSYVTLTQADFAQGTLRIRAGGYFKLLENIVFAPNSSVVDPVFRYTPTTAQRAAGALYAGEAYVRDFFTVVAIEAKNVYLDLNGFSISLSPQFQAAQRFTSIVELADQPFLSTQGPGFFGSVVTAAENTVVANGTIGLSSHHGIHGNNCANILLEQLKIRDYEFSGIAINFGQNCVVYNCELLGTLKNLLYNYRLSAAMFGLRDAAKLLSIAVSTGAATTGDPNVFGTPANIFNAVTAYATTLATIIAPIIDTGTIGNDHSLASKTCTLSDGRQVKVIDGNAYGILFNSKGVAVNGFDEEAGDASATQPDSSQILICNTKITDTLCNVEEVPAFFDTRTDTKGHLVDTTGQLINLSLYFDCVENRFTLEGNGDNEELVRLQLGNVYLRKLIASVSPSTDLSLFQVGRVSDELFALLNPANPTLACDALPAGAFVWKRNGDAMFHVGKGCMAMRLDGVSQLCVRDVVIDTVENCGAKAIVCPLPCETGNVEIDFPDSPNCCPLNRSGFNVTPLERSAYTGPSDGGHPMQGKNIIGYGGNDSYGITCSAVSHFDYSGVNMKNIVSHHGSAVGLFIQCESNDGKVTCTTISEVHAAKNANVIDFSQGVKTPIGNGVRIDTSSTHIAIDKPTISNVTATGYAACNMCINSGGVSVSV